METLKIAKQFDDMWFSKHGKKEMEKLKKLPYLPVKQYTSTMIISRFLSKARFERERKSRLRGASTKQGCYNEMNSKISPEVCNDKK